MKKKLFLIPLLFASLTGCVKYNGRPITPTQTDDDAISSITCDVEKLVFNKGDEKKSVTATIVGEGEYDLNITLKSKDEAVATVSTNKVESGTAFYVNPIAVGETKIVLTSVGNSTVKFELPVEVNDKEAVIPVTEVKLSKNSLTLIEGANETITCTILPENATDKSFTWATSDAGVATVENGKITAIKAGTANITATSTDGQKVDTCVVTVEKDTALTTGYYVVGSMTDWKPEASYKMEVNSGNTAEMTLTWLGHLGDEVKVVKYTEGQTEVEWKQINLGSSGSTDNCVEYTGEGGNAKLLANATYTIYFDKTDLGGSFKYWFTHKL